MYDYYNHFGDMEEVPDMEGMTPDEQEELATHTLLWGCLSYGVAILLGLLLCWVFSGCKGLEKVVTVEKTRTDTLLWYSNTRDSVVEIAAPAAPMSKPKIKIALPMTFVMFAISGMMNAGRLLPIERRREVHAFPNAKNG